MIFVLCLWLFESALPQFLELFEVVKTITIISGETERQHYPKNQNIDIEMRREASVSGGNI